MSTLQYAQKNILLGPAHGAPSVAEAEQLVADFRANYPEVASWWGSIESTETYTLRRLAEEAGRHKAANPPLRDAASEFVEAFENHPPDSVTVRRAFTQLRNTLKNP